MDANSTEAGKSTVLLLRRERDRESPRREKEEGRRGEGRKEHEPRAN